MKNRVICFFGILLAHGFASGQSLLLQVDSLVGVNRNEIKNIDNRITYKIFLETEGYKEYKHNGYSESLFELYFDNKGEIIKLNSIYFPDYSHCSFYFDTNGIAIYTSYFTSSMLGDYSTERYLDPWGNLLYVDHICRDDWTLPSLFENITVKRIILRARPLAEIPDIYEDMIYNNVLSFDDFKKNFVAKFDYDEGARYGGVFPEPPAELMVPVRFTAPEKGDVTSLVQNSVPVYAKPSVRSSVIAELNIRRDIKILDVKGDWCKITLNRTYVPNIEGYIHKDYLASVERIIEGNE